MIMPPSSSQLSSCACLRASVSRHTRWQLATVGVFHTFRSAAASCGEMGALKSRIRLFDRVFDVFFRLIDGVVDLVARGFAACPDIFDRLVELLSGALDRAIGFAGAERQEDQKKRQR